MTVAVLLEDIVNTVLDKDITLAKAGAMVTILDERNGVYEVAYYAGASPSTTFYVQANQLRVVSQ